ALSDKKKKKNIAIGASLGLYAGLLYGAWHSYSSKSSGPSRNSPVVPGSSQPENPNLQNPSYDPSDPLGLGSAQLPSYDHFPIVSYEEEVLFVGYQFNF